MEEDDIHPWECKRIYDVYENIKDDNVKYSVLVIKLFELWAEYKNINDFPYSKEDEEIEEIRKPENVISLLQVDPIELDVSQEGTSEQDINEDIRLLLKVSGYQGKKYVKVIVRNRWSDNDRNIDKHLFQTKIRVESDNFVSYSEPISNIIDEENNLTEKDVDFYYANVRFDLNYLNDNQQSLYRIDHVDSGEKIYTPEKPTREGYEFSGWYTEKECLSSWDFNSIPTLENEVFVLYAGWNNL